MNIGTKVRGELIVDSRFLKNTNLTTAISAHRSGLSTAIYDEGIELYEIEDERELNFKDGTKQIRQRFTLVLTKKLTKNEVYGVVNQFEALPLMFN